jgi:hypothetical protein
MAAPRTVAVARRDRGAFSIVDRRGRGLETWTARSSCTTACSRLFTEADGWRAAGIVLLAATLNALALDPADRPANYIAAHWGTDEGLPHNQVRCIYQTRDGYLWVGLSTGIVRLHPRAFDDVVAGRAKVLVHDAYGDSDGLH